MNVSKISADLSAALSADASADALAIINIKLIYLTYSVSNLKKDLSVFIAN